MKAKYLTFILLFFLSFGADQGSKMWARRTLKPEGYPNAYPTAKVVVKGFFDYRYSENPGSAFGFFRTMSGAKHPLFGVGVVCLLIIGLWLVKMPGQAPWLGAKLGLLAGGAVRYLSPVSAFGRGPSWPAEVAAWRRDHRHALAVWPRPWRADLSDEARPCSPVTRTMTLSRDPRYCESGWVSGFVALSRIRR